MTRKNLTRRDTLLMGMGAAGALSFNPIAALSATPATSTNSPPPLNWPTKTVRIVVGFPAGTTPDLVARTIADPLAKLLGQAVIVDNRAGAGGNIGADIVAKSTDEHTIGLMINGNMTIAKLLNPKTAYDPLTDLEPISLVATAPLVLTATNDSFDGTGKDFFEKARAAGNKWSYGTPGIGTIGHLGMELLKAKTGIEAVHVPYPGYPQAINGMLGGQLQLALLPPALAMAQIKAGKLKGVGVTSAGRSSLVPDMPSLSEFGIKGYQMEIWDAFAAPKSMPKPIVDKLSTLITQIVRTPEVREKLFQQGWTVVGTSAQGLANRVKADTIELGNVIKQQNIKAE